MSWSSTSTARTAIDLGTTLASDTMSAIGAEIDNSVNLDVYGWLELATSTGNLFTSAVTRTNAAAQVFLVQAPDGTAYNNSPASADKDEFLNLLVAHIPLPTEVGVVPQSVGPILLPPHKLKFFLFNDSDQQMANTWELNLYTNNL